jgi:hypothetical protein
MDIAKVFPSAFVQASLPEISISKERVCSEVAKVCFLTASYFTDPLCKGHEFFRRFQIVDTMYPIESQAVNFARKAFLAISLVGYASLSMITTPIGIGLRFAGLQVQMTPFIFLQGAQSSKILPLNRSFSLLSWNVCGIGAGYSISDGGVIPWHMRLGNVIEKILEKNADVNCLYEVFDVQTAFALYNEMKKRGYTHFYFNMGAKPIGTSSGIFVASKYKIIHPEFMPFSQDMLVGRTKHSGKGAFIFDLESQGKAFATICATHMQHSELPEFPTEEEVSARKMQMDLITNKITKIYNRCVLVTGDLNLDDQEYQKSSWQRYFQKGDAFSSTEKTWDGDSFSAKLVGKQVSGPLNLDHTMMLKGSARSIHTSLVRTGFNAKVFKKEALSDHEGLLSHMVL